MTYTCRPSTNLPGSPIRTLTNPPLRSTLCFHGLPDASRTEIPRTGVKDSFPSSSVYRNGMSR